jgi:hypothetical protein
MRFLKPAGTLLYFAFECEGCGERCELGVDVEMMGQRVECHAGCGAVYIMWDDPLTGNPDLFCVVKPVFDSSSIPYSELPEFDDDDVVDDEQDWFDDDDDPDDDELEEALGECGRGQDYEGCMLAGSEYCDFECPFNR